MFLHSRCRAFLFILCTLFVAPPALPQQSDQSTPNIRISVDRVNVGVVVTDTRGQFVSGLHREDFHLFDNGVEQPITDFLTVDEPAQVLLLVEAGPAVYLIEGGHLQAIHALLDGLSPGDRVAIARYNEAPELILEYTPDKRTAAAALDQLRFNLGFGQLNLASSLSAALDWLAHVPGKKSLVLLSTGFDTSPSGAGQNLLARLGSTDVRVLAISLGGELRVSQPPDKKYLKKGAPPSDKAQIAAEGFAQADEELKSIAKANGGRAYFPETNKDFAAVFTEIAQLVRHEYNLGFVPPARDAKLHLIDVRVTGSIPANAPSTAFDPTTTSPYRIDHRQAYIAPPPE
jgi:Ca-activated chloride channel family protein